MGRSELASKVILTKAERSAQIWVIDLTDPQKVSKLVDST
jgi:hypothetical protein